MTSAWPCFKADLYPFYPPRVSLVRPKLEGFVPGAMIAHPRLHLRNWQPFRPIAAVIEHLRVFLARFARVDLASEMNDEVGPWPCTGHSPLMFSC